MMIAMMMIMKQYDILIVGIQPPIFEAGLFTHSQAEHVLVSSANLPRLPSVSKRVRAKKKSRTRILVHSCAQRNVIVHLVIAALRAVAVEAQSLVGEELVGAGVTGGTEGDTARIS